MKTKLLTMTYSFLLLQLLTASSILLRQYSFSLVLDAFIHGYNVRILNTASFMLLFCCQQWLHSALLAVLHVVSVLYPSSFIYFVAIYKKVCLLSVPPWCTVETLEENKLKMNLTIEYFSLWSVSQCFSIYSTLYSYHADRNLKNGKSKRVHFLFSLRIETYLH